MFQVLGFKLARMIDPSRDLENINDNMPLEYQLDLVRRWAEHLGYKVVAATVQRALDELAGRSK
jgi:hypothetical protein